MKNTITTTERRGLTDFLENLFGYHIVQIGGSEKSDFLEASPIGNKIYFTETHTTKNDVVKIQGKFDQLPFLPNSVDVIIMPHVLESVAEPKEVLCEAYQTLIPDGYLLLIGFNPFSLYGVAHIFNSKTGKLINIFRMRKWLLQLGFSIVGSRLLKHSPFTEGFGKKLWPGKDIYILMAQKRVVPLTPIRKKLVKHKVAAATPYAKPTRRV